MSSTTFLALMLSRNTKDELRLQLYVGRGRLGSTELRRWVEHAARFTRNLPPKAEA